VHGLRTSLKHGGEKKETGSGSWVGCVLWGNLWGGGKKNFSTGLELFSTDEFPIVGENLGVKARGLFA